MPQVNVELGEYVNAKEGSLLIKKNGRWVVTSFEELNKNNEEKLKKIAKLESDFNLLAKNNKHFVTYAKSHFMVVFNAFKIKVLSGDLDVEDEEVLKIDETVLNDEISVQDALEKHEFLKETFAKIYLDKKETIEFPEV